MNLNIKATVAEMESFSTTKYTVPFVLNVFDSSENNIVQTVSDIHHEVTIMNFVPKVLDVFNALARLKKPVGSLSETFIDGDLTYVLNLFRTKSTVSLFEVFAKLGISLHRILVTYTPNTKTLSVDSSLLAHLSRLDKAYSLQISIYLRALVHLFKKLSEFKVEDNHFAISKMSATELRISKQVNAQFDGFLYSLDHDFEVNLKEIEYIALDRILIENASYSANLPLANNGSSTALSYISLQKEDQIYTLLRKDSGFYYLVDMNSGDISTTNTLSFLDFDADSQIVGIASSLKMFDQPIVAKKVNIDNLLTGKYQILENHFEIVNPITKEKTENFLYNLVSVRDAVEATDLELYFSDLGRDKFDTDTTSYVSIDSIKKQYESDSYAQQLYISNKVMMDRLGPVDLKELSNMVPSLVKGDTFSMVFTGESGTGKSTTAKYLAYTSGLPFEIINASINIEESDFIGTMVSNKNRKSDLDPMFVWKDGVLARAVRNGYGLLLEEINFARAGVLGKLNSLLDDSRQIELGDGTILKAHPNFRFFATANINEEGTQRLNRALVNRFQHAKKFYHLTKNETIDLIMAKTGYKNKDSIEKVYVVYDAIKKYAKENQLKLSISIRQLINIFNAPKVYKNVEHAIMNLMVNHAFLEEEEHQDHFVETVLSVLDLKFKL